MKTVQVQILSLAFRFTKKGLRRFGVSLFRCHFETHSWRTPVTLFSELQPQVEFLRTPFQLVRHVDVPLRGHVVLMPHEMLRVLLGVQGGVSIAHGHRGADLVFPLLPERRPAFSLRLGVDSRFELALKSVGVILVFASLPAPDHSFSQKAHRGC